MSKNEEDPGNGLSEKTGMVPRASPVPLHSGPSYVTVQSRISLLLTQPFRGKATT